MRATVLHSVGTVHIAGTNIEKKILNKNIVMIISISIWFTKWERKINKMHANNEPHVPGAKGNFPIAPNVAIKCIGFFRLGKSFMFKSVHIL